LIECFTFEIGGRVNFPTRNCTRKTEEGGGKMIKGKSFAKDIKVEPWKVKKTEKGPLDTKEVSFHQISVEVRDVKTGTILNKKYGLPPNASQRRM